MEWLTKVDSTGNEILVNIKPVYVIKTDRNIQDKIKKLKLKRSYKQIELEAIESEIVRLKNKLNE